eukprot:SM000028S10176  [mRNA]  locus=s28:808937:811922:+ [translate_table: standard]
MGAAAAPPSTARRHHHHPLLSPAVRYGALLRLALPSMLLQSAAPAAITVQTALLGHKARELVAVWAVVSTTMNSATTVFNFLVTGVTAKVSKSVGARAWSHVGSRIRLALLCAAAAGLLALGLLAAVQRPVFELFGVHGDVRRPASQYYVLRMAGLPFQLLAMSTTGILQGYKRVYVVAGLNIARLCLDVLGSYFALFVLDLGIWGVGVSNLVAPAAAAAAGLALILNFPPEDGQGKIIVFPRPASAPTPDPSLHGGAGDRKSLPLLHQCEEGGGSVGSFRRGREGLPDVASKAMLVSSLSGRYEGADGGNGASVDDYEKGPWEFIWDGLSTIVRSGVVQASFFMSLVVASRLGLDAVAAHQVVYQLWLITVYVADGFATAGTIVGSDLAGQMDRSQNAEEQALHLRELRMVAHRVLLMGTCFGVPPRCHLDGLFMCGASLLFREQVIGLFTIDPATKVQLRAIWPYLAFAHPLNALVFVYDGLIYAAQAFAYMAVCVSLGFAFLFLPVLGAAHFYFHTLISVWASKVVLNLVRLSACVYKIHFSFLCPPPLLQSVVVDSSVLDHHAQMLDHSEDDAEDEGRT